MGAERSTWRLNNRDSLLRHKSLETVRWHWWDLKQHAWPTECGQCHQLSRVDRTLPIHIHLTAWPHTQHCSARIIVSTRITNRIVTARMIRTVFRTCCASAPHSASQEAVLQRTRQDSQAAAVGQFRSLQVGPGLKDQKAATTQPGHTAMVNQEREKG